MSLEHYQGTARVQLNHLEFPNPTRRIDKRILDELKRSFQRGVRDDQHPIPAKINHTRLLNSLNRSNLDADRLKSKENGVACPKLYFENGFKLHCFDGRHRVVAASEFLPHEERWWSVDLYDEDISYDAQRAIETQYSFVANHSDGEIFRNISCSRLAGDVAAEQWWTSRFNKSKEKKLRLLKNRPKLRAALDSILPIRGIWGAFHAGSLDFFLALRIDEEFIHYIKVIKNTWDEVMASDASLLEFVDEETVEAVQLRTPGLSKFDHDFIQIQMRSGRLFPNIKDHSTRQAITSRLLVLNHPIPSLYVLFKNLRYIEPVIDALKRMLPRLIKRSVREGFRFQFQEDLGGLENDSTMLPNQASPFEIAFRTLAIYGIQHFAIIPGRRDWVYSLFGLASLARKLGFSSVEIERILETDPYHRMAEELVSKALPLFDTTDLSLRTLPLKTELQKLLSECAALDVEQYLPQSTIAGLGEPLTRRCGPAVWSSLSQDYLDRLSVVNLHEPLENLPHEGQGISSFFVKRSIYVGLFGELGTFDSFNQQAKGTSRVRIDVTSLPETIISPAIDAEVLGTMILRNRDTTDIAPKVTFVGDGIVISEVSFREEHVNFQAREYASEGKKLSLPQGGFFLWENCFNILNQTKTFTVFVSSSSITGQGSSPAVL